MIDRTYTKRILIDLQSSTFLKQYLCDYTWLSGSSTCVYPIEEHKQDITIQLNTDTNIFNNFIKETINKYHDIIDDGIFVKSDGSCPSQLIFYYKEVK